MKPLLASLALVLSLATVFAQDDAVKKEFAKFQGNWKLDSGTDNGKPAADELVRILKFTVKDKQLTFSDENLVKALGTIELTIDPATTPKCIDFKIGAGDQKGTVLEGIYEWDKDNVRICVSQSAGNRPVAFESKEGSKMSLFVFKKE